MSSESVDIVLLVFDGSCIVLCLFLHGHAFFFQVYLQDIFTGADEFCQIFQIAGIGIFIKVG